MDEIRAVRTIEQLLFAPSWSQKWRQKPAPKTGPQYCRNKERLPKWRPRFWDQGVAYTVSPPLRAVSSGDSGTFRLFSWQWASQSLIQVSQYIYIYIYIYNIKLQHNLQPRVSGVAPIRGLHWSPSWSFSSTLRWQSDGSEAAPWKFRPINRGQFKMIDDWWIEYYWNMNAILMGYFQSINSITLGNLIISKEKLWLMDWLLMGYCSNDLYLIQNIYSI